MGVTRNTTGHNWGCTTLWISFVSWLLKLLVDISAKSWLHLWWDKWCPLITDCPQLSKHPVPSYPKSRTSAKYTCDTQGHRPCTAKTFAIQLEFSTWIFSHQSTITTPQSWDISHSAPPRGKVERYLLSQLSDICYKTANLNPSCRFMATRRPLAPAVNHFWKIPSERPGGSTG